MVGLTLDIGKSNSNLGKRQGLASLRAGAELRFLSYYSILQQAGVGKPLSLAAIRPGRRLFVRGDSHDHVHVNVVGHR